MKTFKLRRTPKANAQGAMEEIKKMQLADLGDVSKITPVALTEPEIVALHFAIAYTRQNCLTLAKLAQKDSHPMWDHYGPTLEGFMERLKQDEPPVEQPSRSDPTQPETQT